MRSARRRALLLAALLMIVLPVGTTEASTGALVEDPLLRLPDTVRVPRGSSIDLPLPPEVGFVGGNDAIASLQRSAQGVSIEGLRPGRSIAFFLTPSGSKAVPIEVVPPVPVRRDDPLAGQSRAPSILERELGLSTGGWVRRGTLMGQAISTTSGTAAGGRLGLHGGSGDTRYALNSAVLQRGETLMQTHTFDLSAPGLDVRFGNRIQDATFRPASREPIQSLAISARTSGLSFDVGARGPQQMQRLMEPDTLSLRGGYTIAPHTQLQVGSLIGLAHQSGETLPFVGVRYDDRRFVAGLHLGGPSSFSTTPLSTVAAELAGRIGGCRAGLGYATALRDVSGQEQLFASYVTTLTSPFYVGGGCRTGRSFLDVTIRREDVGRRTVFEQGAFIAQTRFHHAHQALSLSGWVQWNLAGRADGRNFGEMQLAWRSGEMQYGVLARAAQPAMFFFQEEAFARWRRGIFDARMAVRATNGLYSLTSVQLVTDAAVRLRWLTTGGGVVTRYGLGANALHSVLMTGHVTWSPFPAYAFSATAVYDPLLLPTPTIFGMLTYAFGDDLPREPILRPLRSSTVRAVVFHDVDRNGVRDEGEAPIAGVEICVDAQTCGVTDAQGNWSASGLTEGWHDVLVRPSRLPGAVPTGPALQRALIGRYAAPTLEFGIAFEGELDIIAFVDANGNGRHDHGERPLPGMKVRVSGPDVTRDATVDRSGRMRLPFTVPGTFEVEVDPLSLPPGYLAGPLSRARVELDGFEMRTVAVGVTPLRTIAGRVCIDLDGDERCDASEPGLGLTRITAGGFDATTDEDGNFLFTLLPNGTFELQVPEIDLPGGHVQGAVEPVRFDARPRSVRGVSVPLKAEVRVARQKKVLVEWPRIGTVSALELAGHLLDERTAPASMTVRDREALDKLAHLVRHTPRTRLYITVSRDAARPPEIAEREAQKRAEELARWLNRVLRVPRNAMVLETAPALGNTPPVDLRLYLFQGRI